MRKTRDGGIRRSSRVATRGLACSLSIMFGVGCADGSGEPRVLEPGSDLAARYRVTFDATWSASTHPTSFPPGPHFSGLIGATHGTAFQMWETGGVATTGIKNMAELGARSALRSEVELAIQAGSAGSVLSGPGINLSPSAVGLTFDVRADYPLVSLVSMLAPSPDWFVGVAGLNLRENGEWVDSVRVDLFPYDAGTDSGANYTSPNSITTPSGTIQRLTQSPFGMNVPVGSFTFIRQ